MNQQEIQNTAENIVGRVERGEVNDLSNELNSMSIEDRVAVAKAADQLNEQHRTADSHLPDFELTIGTDAFGQEYLSNINITQERSKYSPLRLVSERSSTDVYDETWREWGNRIINEGAKLAQINPGSHAGRANEEIERNR